MRSALAAWSRTRAGKSRRISARVRSGLARKSRSYTVHTLMPERAGSRSGVVEWTMSKAREVRASMGGQPTRFQAQVSGLTGRRRSTKVAPSSSRRAAGVGRSRHDELQSVSSMLSAAGSPSDLQFQQMQRELMDPLADTGPVAQSRPVVEQELDHSVQYPTAKAQARRRRRRAAAGFRLQLVDCQ